MDKEVLIPTLKQLADGVTAMFGRNCEVAVHDLTDLRKSLIYLSGNITGREIGSPATDLLIKALSKKEEVVDLYNYKSTTRDGRSIKSTTMLLRDSSGSICAAFCINFDTTEFFNAAQTLAPFINSLASQENDLQETFSVSAAETIDAIYEQTLLEIGKQPATMTTSERLNLVKALEEQGVFQMKGAVIRIAELCGVSKFTIYNYLKTIRNCQKNTNLKGTHEKSYSN